jgi:hypothetical protein
MSLVRVTSIAQLIHFLPNWVAALIPLFQVTKVMPFLTSLIYSSKHVEIELIIHVTLVIDRCSHIAAGGVYRRL